MKLFKIVLILLLALAMLWAIGFALFSLHSLSQTPRAPEQKTDAIIIPTGGKQRIETGLRLLADGYAPHLFITGVNTETSRADILRQWHGETPLPTCCITLGHKAYSTVHNAQETREWLAEKGFRSIRIVTSDYHMNRAWLEFSHALPDIEIYTHPIAQDNLKVNKELLRNLLISEYHKSLYRWFILAVTPRVAVHREQ